jgi:hypothetical protein
MATPHARFCRAATWLHTRRGFAWKPAQKLVLLPVAILGWLWIWTRRYLTARAEVRKQIRGNILRQDHRKDRLRHPDKYRLKA